MSGPPSRLPQSGLTIHELDAELNPAGGSSKSILPSYARRVQLKKEFDAIRHTRESSLLHLQGISDDLQQLDDHLKHRDASLQRSKDMRAGIVQDFKQQQSVESKEPVKSDGFQAPAGSPVHRMPVAVGGRKRATQKAILASLHEWTVRRQSDAYIEDLQWRSRERQIDALQQRTNSDNEDSPELQANDPSRIRRHLPQIREGNQVVNDILRASSRLSPNLRQMLMDRLLSGCMDGVSQTLQEQTYQIGALKKKNALLQAQLDKLMEVGSLVQSPTPTSIQMRPAQDPTSIQMRPAQDGDASGTESSDASELETMWDRIPDLKPKPQVSSDTVPGTASGAAVAHIRGARSLQLGGDLGATPPGFVPRRVLGVIRRRHRSERQDMQRTIQALKFKLSESERAARGLADTLEAKNKDVFKLEEQLVTEKRRLVGNAESLHRMEHQLRQRQVAIDDLKADVALGHERLAASGEKMDRLRALLAQARSGMMDRARLDMRKELMAELKRELVPKIRQQEALKAANQLQVRMDQADIAIEKHALLRKQLTTARKLATKAQQERTAAVNALLGREAQSQELARQVKALQSEHAAQLDTIALLRIALMDANRASADMADRLQREKDARRKDRSSQISREVQSDPSTDVMIDRTGSQQPSLAIHGRGAAVQNLGRQDKEPPVQTSNGEDALCDGEKEDSYDTAHVRNTESHEGSLLRRVAGHGSLLRSMPGDSVLHMSALSSEHSTSNHNPGRDHHSDQPSNSVPSLPLTGGAQSMEHSQALTFRDINHDGSHCAHQKVSANVLAPSDTHPPSVHTHSADCVLKSDIHEYLSSYTASLIQSYLEVNILQNNQRVQNGYAEFVRPYLQTHRIDVDTDALASPPAPSHILTAPCTGSCTSPMNTVVDELASQALHSAFALSPVNESLANTADNEPTTACRDSDIASHKRTPDTGATLDFTDSSAPPVRNLEKHPSQRSAVASLLEAHSQRSTDMVTAAAEPQVDTLPVHEFDAQPTSAVPDNNHGQLIQSLTETDVSSRQQSQLDAETCNAMLLVERSVSANNQALQVSYGNTVRGVLHDMPAEPMQSSIPQMNHSFDSGVPGADQSKLNSLLERMEMLQNSVTQIHSSLEAKRGPANGQTGGSATAQLQYYQPVTANRTIIAAQQDFVYNYPNPPVVTLASAQHRANIQKAVQQLSPIERGTHIARQTPSAHAHNQAQHISQQTEATHHARMERYTLRQSHRFSPPQEASHQAETTLSTRVRRQRPRSAFAASRQPTQVPQTLAQAYHHTTKQVKRTVSSSSLRRRRPDSRSHGAPRIYAVGNHQPGLHRAVLANKKSTYVLLGSKKQLSNHFETYPR